MTSTVKELKPDEKELKGSWVKVDNKIVGDAVCKRIEYLTENFLFKLGYSQYGAWETLYQDPKDRRYWEKVYPHGEMHGGGPPSLLNLSEKQAREKYPDLFKKNP